MVDPTKIRLAPPGAIRTLFRECCTLNMSGRPIAMISLGGLWTTAEVVGRVWTALRRVRTACSWPKMTISLTALHGRQHQSLPSSSSSSCMRMFLCSNAVFTSLSQARLLRCELATRLRRVLQHNLSSLCHAPDCQELTQCGEMCV